MTCQVKQRPERQCDQAWMLGWLDAQRPVEESLAFANRKITETGVALAHEPFGVKGRALIAVAAPPRPAVVRRVVDEAHGDAVLT